MRLLALALALALAPVAQAADDALDEVNAARAARGLPPFARDPGLTAAAQAAADYRAQFRIAGHVPGGMGDFGFLPPGTSADAAGCGALEPSWGWGTCCTYENYQSAGAAVTRGADGRRYMHLFVRRGYAPAMQSTSAHYSGGYTATAQSTSGYYGGGYTTTAQSTSAYYGGYAASTQPMWTYPTRSYSRRGWRR
jgi:hypothetical protein